MSAIEISFEPKCVWKQQQKKTFNLNSFASTFTCVANVSHIFFSFNFRCNIFLYYYLSYLNIHIFILPETVFIRFDEKRKKTDEHYYLFIYFVNILFGLFLSLSLFSSKCIIFIYFFWFNFRFKMHHIFCVWL